MTLARTGDLRLVGVRGKDESGSRILPKEQ